MAAEVILVDSPWRPRLRAALGYLGPAVFIPLFLYRNDKFVYFHTRQGLALWVIAVAAIAALFLPGSGKFLFVVLMGIYLFASTAGILSALLGSTLEIPLIHNLADRYL
jgi:uncharacterized membrane protein